MSRKLRVGIVGAGRIFDLHHGGYADNPDAELAWVCDSDPELLRRRQAELPHVKVSTDFDDLLKDGLDLIEILTPHPLHESMAQRAMQAGAHVSVQKPMSMTVESCDAMIAAAAQTGRHLKLFENFVFYPPLLKARELLLAGAIGDPISLRIKVTIGDRSQGWHVPATASAWRQELRTAGMGGPLVFDHGHHVLAVALWLFGDVADCFGYLDETAVESAGGKRVFDAPATLVWRHRNPRLHAVCDFALALKMELRTDYYASDERFEIQGESGLLTVTHCSGRMLEEPSLTLYSKGRTESWHNLDSDWGRSFHRSTRHFVDFLRGRESDIVLTGAEGRRVVELYHAVARSGREARSVTLPA